jgi:hypothetical protein
LKVGKVTDMSSEGSPTVISAAYSSIKCPSHPVSLVTSSERQETPTTKSKVSNSINPDSESSLVVPMVRVKV